MKKTLKILCVILLTAVCTLLLTAAVSAYWEPEEAFGAVKFTIGKQTTAWKLDGTITDGEYYKVDIDPTWLSYAINDNDTEAGLAYAKETHPELYMSWDEKYVYTATKYEVKKGHENLWDEDPTSMWYSGAVQFNYANFREIVSAYRLEYGVGLSSDTGNMLYTVWADASGALYKPSEEDAKVWLDGNTLTYETRVPWDAFVDEDNTGYREGNGFNFCLVWSIGKSQDYVHIQLAEGSTGNGKNAENFAQVTLGPAPEAGHGAVVDSGKCGDDLTWTLYEDGLLEISGTGDMWNYEPWGDGVAPWSEYASNISFKLTTLKLNEGVTRIGFFAFYGCKDFSGTLNFPESVTIVGENAFMGCSGFTGKLVIPCNLKGIQDWAFAGMKGISEIEVESGNTALCAIDGILYSKNKQSLVLCPAGRTKKVEIEPTTVRIENYAFYGCSGLTGQLVIPESVTKIGLVAFENCSGLTGDLIIPKNVDRIYQRAFSGCSGISNVYFEGNAPSDFGSDVFRNCGENLTLYYLNGNEGWTTPEWNGYPCYPYGDAPETVDATGVSLDKTTATLTVGDTLTLVATVAPDDATDKSVTWETSDPAIATVDNGVVTAVAEGTATVTVTTKDGGFKAECAVTVKAAPVPGEYERGDVNGDNKLDSNDAIYLLRHTMSPSRYEINQSGDMNGDGKVDSNDAIYLLRHTMSPERYPLKG